MSAVPGLPGFDEKIPTTTTPWNPDRRRSLRAALSRFTNENDAAFGEIKKQLVAPAPLPTRRDLSLPRPLSPDPLEFAGSTMEFSRNEDDELRSPEIMARSIPAQMPKVDGGGWGEISREANGANKISRSFVRAKGRRGTARPSFAFFTRRRTTVTFLERSINDTWPAPVLSLPGLYMA